MKITINSFGDLKVIDEVTIKNLVSDTSKVFERKFDGTAGIINVDPTECKIYGRGILKDGTQQDYTATFPDLQESIDYACHEFTRKIPGFSGITLLGEIVVLNDSGDESFKGIESRCNRKKDIDGYAEKFPAQFMIFDILCLNGKDLCGLPFSQRRAILEQYEDVFEETDRLLLIRQEVQAAGKQYLLDRVSSGKFGMEGIVVKDLHAAYPNNSMKYKYKSTEDVYWKGEYKEGAGKNKGKIGSLVCYQLINGVELEVAQVGGGLTDALREELLEAVRKGEVSEENRWVVEVQTHELLPSGKLRYPAWIRRRFDKSWKQCVRTLEGLKSAGKAVKSSKVPKAPEPTVEKPAVVNTGNCRINASLDAWL